MSPFDHIVYWHWWVITGVLLILELTTPSFFFLWLSAAAGVTGLVVFFVPLDLIYQLVLFAVLSALAISVWRFYFKVSPAASDQPNLNRRGAQYTGRVFTLQEPIINGQGKIRVDDSTWKVESSDCPAGTRVKVTGVDGVILRAEIVA